MRGEISEVLENQGSGVPDNVVEAAHFKSDPGGCRVSGRGRRASRWWRRGREQSGGTEGERTADCRALAGPRCKTPFKLQIYGVTSRGNNMGH